MLVPCDAGSAIIFSNFAPKFIMALLFYVYQLILLSISDIVDNFAFLFALKPRETKST